MAENLKVLDTFYEAKEDCEVKVIIFDKVGKKYIAEHHKINKGEKFKMNLLKKEVSKSE